jgi:hypothetical protein
MDARFSILTFPQRFDGTRLHFHILVVPKLSTTWNGNPLLPLLANVPNPGDTATPFADADLQFEARVISGLERFPTNTPVDAAIALPAASGVVASARPLIEELVAPGPGRFRVDPSPPRLAPEPVKELFIQKYLPVSYRDSFLFTGPRTRDALTGDAYHCAIRKATAPNPTFVSTADTVSWGQVYAYCLRHHQLARKIGLIRSDSIPVDDGLFADGGFLSVDLSAQSDYAAQLGADYSFIAHYAARIPKLTVGSARTLFAAVQFPVLFDDPAILGPPGAPGNFDAVFIEASEYDDGFAKIVHGTQPVSQNLLAEDPDDFAPLTDIGVRLGWDDEQILIWQNRQMKTDPTVPKVGGKAQRLDVPMGVFGYRIDAREKGDPAWHSLVRVESKAPMTLGDVPISDPPESLFNGELNVEVHPMQIDGNQATGQYWLPMYMAQWNGASPVLPDEAAARIFRTEEADGKAAALGRMYNAVGLDAIQLRYSRIYEFRVRFADPTGGGPLESDTPSQEGPAPVSTIHFRRHVVPEPVRIENLPKFPDVPLDTPFADDTLVVTRPLLGYPCVSFTGKYADPIPMLVDAAVAATGKESFGIPDPDVKRVRIDVEIRSLKMDNHLSISGREPYAKLYTTTRDFSDDPTVARTIPLTFIDANVLTFGDPGNFGDLGLSQAELDARDDLVLPTARDIRLTIRAVADDDPTYFANAAHIGKPTLLTLRREASDERELFATTVAAKRIRGIYMRPDQAQPVNGTFTQAFFRRQAGDSPTVIEKLAQQLRTDHKGLTLVGKPGERVIFGCSRRIRHTLSPDNSSLTFATKEDLANHWIVALTMQLDRDWTWDGFKYVSAEIFRTQKFRADAEVDDNKGKPIGDWEVIPTASLQMLQDPQRSRTTLIFLDAVEPKATLTQPGPPGESRFPDVIDLEYRIEPRFRSVPAQPPAVESLQLTLPVTSTPTQVPKIVSAGLALSKYQRNDAYSSTEPRRRSLWLELDSPLLDPNDAYFIRMLGYAPDPLLSDGRLETYVPPEEPPLAIDPEVMRVITPEEPDDNAGFGAMTELVPSGTSDRHFLVPLPPGLNADSAELFGFFTYELRVGHAKIWSTAQGRFGRALRSTGVQHPAPTLFCTTHRDEKVLVVDAPYAAAVLNGKRITAKPPRTELWALLYAQVSQADGKDHRNILLDDRKLMLVPLVRGRGNPNFERFGNLTAFQNLDSLRRGVMQWDNAEIAALLADLGLPMDSPLSVLCVEMMPTLEALRDKVQNQAVAFAAANPLEAMLVGGAPQGMAFGEENGPQIHPLTDALGQYRILRTSPLTQVQEICCADC